MYNLCIYQTKVKICFLNADLVLAMLKQEGKVYELVKLLYVLKQVLKQWHEKIDQVILSNGFPLTIVINVLI